jgi:N utilization substance protein A
VRLGSKLCGWDIEIMTREELDEAIERAVTGFAALEGVDPSLAEKLVGEGFLTYDDLSIIEPDDLMEMGELTQEQVDSIVAQAEVKAEEAEHAAAEQRRRQREQERIAAATAAAEALEGPSPADAAMAEGAAAEAVSSAEAEATSGNEAPSGNGQQATDAPPVEPVGEERPPERE